MRGAETVIFGEVDSGSLDLYEKSNPELADVMKYNSVSLLKNTMQCEMMKCDGGAINTWEAVWPMKGLATAGRKDLN